MKTNCLKPFAVLLSLASLAPASISWAQETAANTQPAPLASAEPQIGYGASQVLQLHQANVGDETIVAYIHNSGNSYALNADQIIYLRQQGVSSTVLNTMLSQPATGIVASPGPAAATDVVAPEPASSTTYYAPAGHPSIVGPSVSAIDPSAAASASYSYYYYPPAYPYYASAYYAPAYYAPYYHAAYAYGCYPHASVSIGFGGYYHSGYGGYGYHGGYGTYHGGYGSYHGGGSGGYHGGGGGYHGGGHH